MHYAQIIGHKRNHGGAMGRVAASQLQVSTLIMGNCLYDVSHVLWFPPVNWLCEISPLCMSV